MADLHEARGLAVADVGDAPSEHLEVRQRALVRLAGSGHGDAEHPGARGLGVAADRSGQERHAPLAPRCSRMSLEISIETVDASTTSAGARSGSASRPLRAGHHLLEVARPGDHGDHDVAIGEVHRMLDEPGATIDQWLRLRARAVVDSEIAAAFEQPSGEHLAHAADSDPAEGLAVRRGSGHLLLPTAVFERVLGLRKRLPSIAAAFFRCQRAAYSALMLGRASATRVSPRRRRWTRGRSDRA